MNVSSERFWISLTVVLSVFFAIALPLSIIEKHGTFKTVLFTVIGVVFIWVTYFVRAYFFSDRNNKSPKK